MKPLKSSMLIPLSLSLLFFAALYFPALHMRHELGVGTVSARSVDDYLTFNPKLPYMELRLPTGMWQLPDGPQYKNDRLAEYQRLLQERGITDVTDLRLLAGQILLENGALAEDRNGDSGCSVGIPQRNVCQYGYSAKSFVRKYPEWKDYHFQLTWMADRTADSYRRFDSNVKCAIIYHNRPASALNGCRDTAAGYYRKAVAQASLLSSL